MQPSSVLYVCEGIPWDNNYKHLRLYDSATAAQAAIIAKARFTFTKFNYISKTNSVRVDGVSDQFKMCNYIAYNNAGYSDKWYYAFITSVEYLADKTAIIHFEEDVFQTWFYNMQIQPCFVEREHVNDDTIGLHTVPENIMMGDPVCTGTSNQNLPHRWWLYVTQLADGVEDLVQQVINPGEDENATSGYYKLLLAQRSDVNAIVGLYTVKGMLEALVSMFALTGPDQLGPFSISVDDTFSDYTPKNNKLLCYPYNYLTVVMAGSERAYRYEWFEGRHPQFMLKQPLYAGGSTYLYPVSYYLQAGTGTDQFALEASVPTGAYPTASFGANQFQNYLIQQGPQIAISLAGDLAAVVGGVTATAATGGLGAAVGGGMIASGATGIANTIADINKHSLVSETVKGSQSVSNIAYDTQLVVRLKNMQILPEYARIIDDYFTAFGYKICRIKAPNITGRPAWNYVKTIDSNVTGNAPDTATQKIREILDRGVTFWHTDNVGDYSLNNSL